MHINKINSIFFLFRTSILCYVLYNGNTAGATWAGKLVFFC